MNWIEKENKKLEEIRNKKKADGLSAKIIKEKQRRWECGMHAVVSGQLLSAAVRGGYARVDELNAENRKNGHFERLRKNKIGKPRDVETKKKLKASSSHSWREVSQYTKDGKWIKDWPNFVSIKDKLGFNHTNICACCQNKPKYKSAYGFIWKYKNKY